MPAPPYSSDASKPTRAWLAARRQEVAVDHPGRLPLIGVRHSLAGKEGPRRVAEVVVLELKQLASHVTPAWCPRRDE